MNAVVTSSVIKGSISAPPSKSAMQRACALGLLNDGDTIIENPGTSNDDLAALNICRNLGATVRAEKDSVLINSSGIISTVQDIDCGESGLSVRMFAPIAALSNSTTRITGSGSLLNRPMHFIDEYFPLLDVRTTSNKGYLPINLTGPLQPHDINIDGSLSSQYLTGLLFAFASSAKELVTITVSNLKSTPYIDLSLQMLAHFGYNVEKKDYSLFFIRPTPKIKRQINYYTEGDWSSAAFLFVAGAIAGSVEVHGLDQNSLQADRQILQVLANANATVILQDKSIAVTASHKLKAFTFDATNCPDLFPPLLALAANCDGTSVITGVSRLVGKESNRATSLSEVFGRMGIEVNINNDSMLITGNRIVKNCIVNSHNDHRIAMAAAVAALTAKGDILVENTEVVNKSYPRFFDDLRTLGAAVSLSD